MLQGIAHFEGAGERKVVQKLRHPRTDQLMGQAINEVKDDTMYMVWITLAIFFMNYVR